MPTAAALATPQSKLVPNPEFARLASDEAIQLTALALGKNGFTVLIAENGDAAREKVLGLLAEGEEVLTVASRTTQTIGLAEVINHSGRYHPVSPRLTKMNRNTEADEMRSLGARPKHVVGSVHALTQDGHALIASGGGSQIAPYVYGAGKVIWVVGSQKIVKDTAEALRRIEEYSYPLEDQRALEAYGVNSLIGKVLIVNKEANPGRVTIVIVKENLGF